MEIKEIDINLIHPYVFNAKLHDDVQINNVAESIKQFGWQQPIVVDKNYEIIIGHCRYLAAKKLGLEKVPVVVADKLDETQVRKLRLLDNKTNESEWDFNLLKAEIDGGGELENLEELVFDGFNIDWCIPQISDDTTFLENDESDYQDKVDSNNNKEFVVCPNCGLKINVYGK